MGNGVNYVEKPSINFTYKPCLLLKANKKYLSLPSNTDKKDQKFSSEVFPIILNFYFVRCQNGFLLKLHLSIIYITNHCVIWYTLDFWYILLHFDYASSITRQLKVINMKKRHFFAEYTYSVEVYWSQ